MPGRARKFTTVSGTLPMAGGLPAEGTPSDTPANSQGAVKAVAVPSPTSDFVSNVANNVGTEPDITLDDMVGGRLSPELDLAQTGWRVPRYVKEAVRLRGITSRTPEQSLVTEALLAYAPLRQALRLAYRKASG